MTIEMEIEVENLKCGGCARSILKGLSEVPGITDIAVDNERQVVKFVGAEASRVQVADKLRSMGYPETGTLEGLSAGLANAKSFVSCAIGRMSWVCEAIAIETTKEVVGYLPSERTFN
jgi:copper chaperone